MTYRQDLAELLLPAVQAVGYELYACEFISQGKHSVLRVYITHADGISVDDCAKTSEQVSALLDVEDPINGEYRLEVSSPGIERPLFIERHYQQAMGKEIDVKLRNPINGQRHFAGQVKMVNETKVILCTGEQEFELPLADIAKAYLVFNKEEQG